MTDVRGSDEDHDQVKYHREIAEREWERLSQNHGNYSLRHPLFLSDSWCFRKATRMALLKARRSEMQRGFDQGFKDGLVIGKAFRAMS